MSTTKVRANQVFGIPEVFAPILRSISPLQTPPETTTYVSFYGEFFNPNTSVTISNVVVNSIEFISTKEIKVGITTSVNTGFKDVTVNNGKSRTFREFFLVDVGNLTIPTVESWTTSGAIINNGSELNISTYDASGTAEGLVIPANKDFRLEFKMKIAITAPENPRIEGAANSVNLVQISDNAPKYKFRLGYIPVKGIIEDGENTRINSGFQFTELNSDESNNFPCESVVFKRVGDNVSIYSNRDPAVVINYTTYPGMGDMKVKFTTDRLEYFDIKYLEL
jgi:hypothetical protein